MFTGCFENDLRRERIEGAESSYRPELNVGMTARDLLSDLRFKKLVVEIQPVRGFSPSQDAINRLQLLLEKRLHKPGGVRIVLDEPINSPGKATYNVTEVREIEDRHRKHFPAKDELVAYYLFLDGRSSDDQGQYKTLGQAHRNTSMVIFENTIRGLTTGAPTEQPIWVLEYAVMAHEFGHILGLTNIGTPMQTPHQEPGQGSHCDEKTCLMNHALETGDVINNLFSPLNLPDFDGNCLADLKANGGR